ncbi:MAG: RNA polymerase sigma factor [Gammaproteobacteria bacterium]|nr:RNA polymerase sigma factor [Gammaproteobacteria bacterium]
MDDKSALLDIQNGGINGLEVLYKRYGAKLKERLIVRYSVPWDMAEDICNNVFMRFHIAIEEFKEECSIYTWLCVLAHSELRWFHRRYGKQKCKEFEDTPALAEEPSMTVQDIEEELHYEQCVEQLFKQAEQNPADAASLQALAMRVLGLSTEETANKIGRTPGTASAFLSASKKKFRQRFKQFQALAAKAAKLIDSELNILEDKHVSDISPGTELQEAPTRHLRKKADTLVGEDTNGLNQVADRLEKTADKLEKLTNRLENRLPA